MVEKQSSSDREVIECGRVAVGFDLDDDSNRDRVDREAIGDYSSRGRNDRELSVLFISSRPN